MICSLLLFLAVTAGQGPGDGYILAPSPPRQIKTLYWELFQSTETWIRITPTLKDGNPAPAGLIFSVTFHGKKQDNAPETVTIRAQSDPRFVATRFSLKLTPHPGDVLDLTAPGANFQYSPNCPGTEGCAVTGIISVVPWKVFNQLILAESIKAEVLGLEVSLQEADLGALREFARRLTPASTTDYSSVTSKK